MRATLWRRSQNKRAAPLQGSRPNISQQVCRDGEPRHNMYTTMRDKPQLVPSNQIFGGIANNTTNGLTRPLAARDLPPNISKAKPR